MCASHQSLSIDPALVGYICHDLWKTVSAGAVRPGQKCAVIQKRALRSDGSSFSSSRTARFGVLLAATTRDRP
jgi:hypothetical protein